MPISYEEAAKPGLSYEDAYQPPPSLARSAADWATSAIRGLAKGTIGLAGQFGDIPQAIVEKGHEYGVPRPPEGGLQAFPGGTPFPTSEELTKKIGGEGKDKNAAGKFLGGHSESKGGEYLESIGEMAVPSAIGKGGAVKKGVQAIAGGSGSQALGDLAKKYLPDHETAARVIGAIFGQGIPGMVRKTVAPSTIPPTRQTMVDTLRREGVEPTAGDVSGSRALKYAEHGLGDAPGGGGSYSAAREKTGEQYTAAALRNVGETGNRASAEVIDRAFTRIGGDFDTLSARNSAKYDPQYARELVQAKANYDHLFDDPLKAPIVNNVLRHAVKQWSKSGIMDGEQYQAVRSRLERMRRGSDDSEVKAFLGDVQKSMDDLMERSIAQNNPGDLGAWKAARRQYRNMLVLEQAATGAGEAAADGIISPAKLRQAVVAQSRRGYARGQGDFSELARAGEGVLKPPPSSGTTERAWVHAIPSIIGSGIGGALAHGTPEALPAAFGGAFAPGVVGRGLMSRPAQSYLKNGVANALGVSVPFLDRLRPGQLDKIVTSVLAAQTHEQGR